MTPRAESGGGVYRREGAGLEFDRVAFFTDAVYAIAMTLLVVELHPPQITNLAADPVALRAALLDERPAILGFFIGFLVIGRYWIAHHRFFASLASIGQGMIWLNLIYLGFIAFAPFPVALISRYADSPLSFIVFAVSMATVSGLEVLLLALAVRGGHLRRARAPGELRGDFINASAPVALMLLSIPIVFVSPSLALLSWLLMIPLALVLRRRAPRNPAA